MKFAILGPLVVTDDTDREITVTAGQRTLLGTLLLHANRAVSVNELAESLWDGAPPARAGDTLRTYVMRLRRALGAGARIRTRTPGYLIDVDEDELDLLRFEALSRDGIAAARAGAWEDAAEALGRALDLWQGTPLQDVSPVLREAHAPRLGELRRRALEWRIEADLHLGAGGELVDELSSLVEAHPLQERFHAQLMLALYRGGRQAEALAAYQRLRETLVGELGIDPGPEAKDLHQRILAGDCVLTAASPDPGGSPAAAAPPAIAVPRQLPPVPRCFVGRADELKALSGIVDGMTGTVATVEGGAGIGKTTLAVYWAHLVAGLFPDAQLYANLRGFDRSGTPVRPTRIIWSFLHALGVPPARIPADLDAQVGLYRSVLAGRRVLVVLDNARDADQVRPLLPPAGCFAVVTSRACLTGLAAVDGARRLVLEVFTPAEARELLTRQLGVETVLTDEKSAVELIGLCAGLPLALSIATARRPGAPLAEVVCELAAEDRLDALDGGEPVVNLRSVFSWSVENLSWPAARMFRLCGVHPGPDISGEAAAALAGVPMTYARRMLTEVTRQNLMTAAGGRFGCHDLLRAYAAEQARDHDGPAEVSVALGRVMDHYLHTAVQVARILRPARDLFELPPPHPAAAPVALSGYEQALRWCRAEHEVLLAAIRCAFEAGLDRQAWQLACLLKDYLDRRGHWQDWVSAGQTALRAAQRSGDEPGIAAAHHYLANALVRLGHHGDAGHHFRAALDLRAGDPAGQADNHNGLARAFEHQGRYADALDHATQALDLYRRAGHLSGQAVALNSVGWYHALLGNYPETLGYCRQALDTYHDLGDRYGEAHAWDSLGYAHHHLGDTTSAIECYRQAIALCEQIGDRYDQAVALDHLGDVQAVVHDPSAARDTWGRALAILTDLGHVDAARIRPKLR